MRQFTVLRLQPDLAYVVRMYNTITSDISVSVLPVYIVERSKPGQSQYYWAYRVVIKNESSEAIQLISRYWHIRDGNGKVQEVSGAGVVGEKPMIEPGQSYEYTSGCPLKTSSGIMAGHYTMQKSDGSLVNITIPTFSLDLPDAQPTVN